MNQQLKRMALRRNGTMNFGGSATDDNIDDTIKRRFSRDRLDVNIQRICDSLNCHKVTRLVKAATSDTPPVLEGQPGWFGSTNSEGFNRLHILARSFDFALHVCTHDNGLTMLEHNPELAASEIHAMNHQVLMADFDPDEGTTRYERKLRLDDYNDEAYHALVNYITATFACIIVRTVDQRFWVENTLASLAKYAAKIKVVGADLPLAVSKTVQAQRDFQVRMRQNARANIGLPSMAPRRCGDCGNDRRGEGDGEEGDWERSNTAANWQAALREEQGTWSAWYFQTRQLFDHHINILLHTATEDLMSNEETEKPGDVFETSSIIYSTGFGQARVQLCQERDKAISSAADRDVVRCAGVTFDVCREIWGRLPHREGPPGQDCTYLDWSWTERTAPEAAHPERRVLTTMQDVISALVPHFMFCGPFANCLAQSVSATITIFNNTQPIAYFVPCTVLAAAHIRTSKHIKNQKSPKMGATASSPLSLAYFSPSDSSSSSTRPVHYQSVYDSFLAQERALARQVDDSDEATNNRLSRYKSHNKRLKEAMDQADSWDVSQGSIRIASLWYSWIVLAVVAVMIAGAVALIAVQERIPGVDPSNITVLVWTATGFFVVYCKSRRVENWPWRDFLRGCIVCRSLSELHAVTKIDSQVLLAILLRNEPYLTLEKSGPFCALFNRKASSESDGFVIDVPPLTKTAMTGGHIFIRVNSDSGPALVDLETRRWERYNRISPRGHRKDGKGYACRDYLDPGRYQIQLKPDDFNGKLGGTSSGSQAKHESTKSLHLYTISTNEIQWYQVQGIFSEQALFK